MHEAGGCGGGLHDAYQVHATQSPPLVQTWLSPHQSPGDRGWPVSVHVPPVVAHWVRTARWHGSSGSWQLETPSSHQVHCPPLHTYGPPPQQAVPSSAGPTSLQTGWPVSHAISPARQVAGLPYRSTTGQLCPA